MRPIRWPFAAAPSKYHAEPVELDGLRFASKREAARYAALRLLERAGQIRNLQLQPRYPLATVRLEAGRVVDTPVVATYVADFAYVERTADGAWQPVVEDAKGVRTPVYRLKRKWFQAQYGACIREV
jgi:hypothetical protein